LSQLADAAQLGLGSPGLDGDLDQGVDSKDACTQPMAADGGAVSPVLAVQPEAADEALVVWRSVLLGQQGICSARSRALAGVVDRCALAELPRDCAHESQILALRVSAHDNQLGSWLERSASDSTSVLGRAAGTAPAAVAAWSNGYVVAYAAEQGIALHLLELGGAAPAAWLPPRILTAGAADHVALSLASVDAPRGALAWREGCGSRASVQLRLFDATASGELAQQPVLTLAREVEVQSGPVLMHVERGLSQRADAPGGGWLAFWVEQTRDAAALMFARIAQTGDCLIEAPRELARGELGAPVATLLASADARVSVLRWSEPHLELVNSRAACASKSAVAGPAAESVTAVTSASDGLSMCQGTL
jgi:hypothetical protein